jgi:hypothetical protein
MTNAALFARVGNAATTEGKNPMATKLNANAPNKNATTAEAANEKKSRKPRGPKRTIDQQIADLEAKRGSEFLAEVRKGLKVNNFAHARDFARKLFDYCQTRATEQAAEPGPDPLNASAASVNGAARQDASA